MNTKDRRKSDEWRAQVHEAEAHPGGVAAYCRTKGIPLATMSYWRKKFRDDASEMRLSPFVRAEVVAAQPILPDAKWLAEFLNHLVRSSQ